jgi:phospholipase C
MNRHLKIWFTARKTAALFITAALLLAATISPALSKDSDDQKTDTPIKHVVVIFQENVSFDHYFATYPHAKNPAGEPAFHAKAGTPTVNGLNLPLLLSNPNPVAPFRFDRSQAATCDQDHGYTDEQKAYDGGLVDKFALLGNGPGMDGTTVCKKSDTMGWFDGNTVTAMWNYAQRFSMSDNSFNTTFGPSTPGALNLIAGQTHGVVTTSGNVSGDVVDGSVVSDPQPLMDKCTTREAVQLAGTKNVGDLLNSKGITWGWFQGGFDDCTATHNGADNKPKGDYIAHHEPFQYFTSTWNPNHLAPKNVGEIGHNGRANHQYDITRFFDALDAGRLPSVSYLKAAGFQDGHAGYSSPLLEQQFVVETINRLQQSPEWKEMAIIIAWDDSDGWYDHVQPPIVSQSDTSFDSGCGKAKAGAFEGRCGYGPRLPLLVISPYAKLNFVDHTTSDQSSVLRFIEDNFDLGRIGGQSFDAIAGPLNNMFDFKKPHFGRLFLDPETGQPINVEDE